MNKCEECGKETNNPKFCSHSCSAVYNNPNRKKTRLCINCGNERKKTAKKYCSHDCEVEFKYASFIEKWLSGQINVSKPDLPNKIRIWLGKQRGEVCWECGWSKINPTTGNVPLDVHHLDGEAKNNNPENLKLLCPNCHSLTDTYKSLNKGKGRESRYKK